MNSRLEPSYRRNPLLLKRLHIKNDLYLNLEDICRRCINLVHLNVGEETIPLHDDGRIWNGQTSINDPCFMIASNQEDDDSSSSADDYHEIDVKVIAQNLHKLEILNINSGVQLEDQTVAPPTLDELRRLTQLQLCCIGPTIRCDRTRDEWNLRVLSQSSTKLKILDIRGCYLKILSLGWLKTKNLTALHLYYQVPAASVLFRWAHSLEYLTLAKISRKYRAYRSLGPEKPAEELDACLQVLARTADSKLQQIDLQESEFSSEVIKKVITNCYRLSYLDTRGCSNLHLSLQTQLKSRADIVSLFIESGSVPVSQ